LVPLHSNISAILLARTAKDSTSFDSSMLYLILALVSFFVLVIVIIFLRKRVVPLFRLWYISLVHGRYSFEFLEFFKENNLRNPHNSCVKDEITLHFMVFFRPLKNAQEYTTNTRIDFDDIPYMISEKKLFKLKGVPDCVNITTFNDARVKVVGYNETLQGMKMKSLYYFIDNQFLMGEYVFPELLRVKPVKIKETLSAKYLNKVSLDGDVFYITDNEGNKLCYEYNGFSIGIKYLYLGDTGLTQVLTNLFRNGSDGRSNFVKALHNDEMLNRF